MMKKNRFSSLISAFFLIPALILSVSAQEKTQRKQQTAALGRETRVDSVLASVNGEPITLLDLILESGNAEIRRTVAAASW